MAKKGQKFNKYTEELKEIVIKEYLSGVSSWYLERKYNIPYKTIQTWGRKIKNPELYPNAGIRRGRPKESEIDYKERYEILKKYRAFLKVQRERK